MALAGGIGAGWYKDEDSDDHEFNFGEEQGRYLVTADPSVDIGGMAAAAKVGMLCMGSTGGNDLRFGIQGRKAAVVSLADLRAAHEGFFPKLMGGELTPEF